MKRPATISQILHVFNGKRTPSMFYTIEKNGWHAGFLLSSAIQREQLDAFVHYFLQNGWVTEEEKRFTLTEKGEAICREYFHTHYYPQHIQDFSYATIRIPFWNRLQLYSQVFSELSYQNSMYIPVIKDPRHQENVRDLFRIFSHDKKNLLQQWVKEQVYLYEQIDEQMADTLVNLLTGHHRIGKTKEQIRQALNMETLEFQFYLNDAIEVLIKVIRANKNKTPLSFAILDSLFTEKNLGLSESTKQTYNLLKAGYSLEKIAADRNIKVNTVREHVLEMAFVFEVFPFKQFVPQKVYEDLNRMFEKKASYTYKEAVSEFKDLEFMHFRLVEIERMRRQDEQN